MTWAMRLVHGERYGYTKERNGPYESVDNAVCFIKGILGLAGLENIRVTTDSTGCYVVAFRNPVELEDKIPKDEYSILERYFEIMPESAWNERVESARRARNNL